MEKTEPVFDEGVEEEDLFGEFLFGEFANQEQPTMAEPTISVQPESLHPFVPATLDPGMAERDSEKKKYQEEIEKLRKERKDADALEWESEINKYKEEIERLKIDRESERKKYQVEIERLSAATASIAGLTISTPGLITTTTTSTDMDRSALVPSSLKIKPKKKKTQVKKTKKTKEEVLPVYDDGFTPRDPRRLEEYRRLMEERSMRMRRPQQIAPGGYDFNYEEFYEPLEPRAMSRFPVRRRL